MRQAADEMHEIEKRKLNLIFSGIPEGNQDVEEVTKFAKMAGSPVIGSSDIVSTNRLSLANIAGRPRLLCVKFASTAIRRRILTVRRPTLENHKENIFVRPDLTLSQQEADKRLREELMVKGKDMHMIRRGKVIRVKNG